MLVMTLLAVAAALPAAEPADGVTIAVVVGARSEVSEMTLDTLRELYLRRRRVWPDGRRAIPVNLPVDTGLRQAFSRRVLGRPPQHLGGYWNRLYFDGIQPPLVLGTPEAVCAYLAVEPRAIGYVRPEDVQRDACRVLLLLPPDDGID
jgi:hypothetical protein